MPPAKAHRYLASFAAVGMVARERYKKVGDLKGRRIVLDAFDASDYLARSLLASAGIKPNQVQFVPAASSKQAGEQFLAGIGVLQSDGQ